MKNLPILRDIRKLEERSNDLIYQNSVLYWNIRHTNDEKSKAEMQAKFDANEKLIYKFSDAIEAMNNLYDMLCNLA